MTAEAKAAWTEAFVKAQAEFPEIPKSKTVTVRTKQQGTYSYDYAPLPAIVAAVKPILKKHGLAVGQSIRGVDGGIGVDTRIYHTGGHVETFGPVVLPGGDAKEVGSSATYGRRYGLCAALGIAADEDVDAPPQNVEGAGSATAQPSEADSGASDSADPELASSIDTLAKELGWSGSKVLKFARDNGITIVKADWSVLSDEDAGKLEAALAQEVASAS